MELHSGRLFRLTSCNHRKSAAYFKPRLVYTLLHNLTISHHRLFAKCKQDEYSKSDQGLPQKVPKCAQKEMVVTHYGTPETLYMQVKGEPKHMTTCSSRLRQIET